MILTRICILYIIDYAITNNLTSFILMQNHCNLVYREEEREMFSILKVCLLFLIARNHSKIPD
ncbi:hypothetical protein GYMLUDRAFT_183043 [Collybiopsis luxurians FD-317 M1]|uniref:Uncharacterized protein n=1 Tax=Collybiopsis luxurians FD-317 M1 TaxID=944289 RepID=A0A0D0AJ84_9AGAR|nr:hypothetical protein GYMLUDRAFT_183043 [Collybiopsis luxurians FD-317 M1]